jgi:hypothetical protein
VTGAVEDTVRGVGDALGRIGVSDGTQGAAAGVASPNSAVGQTVDGTAGAVRGLLDSDR